MYSLGYYDRVGRACQVEGMNQSAAGRQFEIDRNAVANMLKHAVPPRYLRQSPATCPRLDPFVAVIDQALEEDKSGLKTQRQTVKRILQRLRDEPDQQSSQR